MGSKIAIIIILEILGLLLIETDKEVSGYISFPGTRGLIGFLIMFAGVVLAIFFVITFILSHININFLIK